MTFPRAPETRGSTGASTTTAHGDSEKAALRQRRSIPSTIAEEEHVRDAASRPPRRGPTSPRRTSSYRTSDSSSLDSRRTSFRSDSIFLPPRADDAAPPDPHEEPSLWYSAPLLFAIVPAIGGVAFKKGSVLLTDLALLVLTAVYLNWCLITPWIWYHSARKIRMAEAPWTGQGLEDALVENDAEGEERAEEDEKAPHAGEFPDKGEENVPYEPGTQHPATSGGKRNAVAAEASAELELHELVALAMCVFGPLLGSYVLHLIRHSLSKLHGGQLVSNLHLTLFVLGAELRPIRHCIKLVQARTLHLQRVVRSDMPAPEEQAPDSELVRALADRMHELEASLAEAIVSKSDNEKIARTESSASPEDVKKVQQSLQTQIDALNRAVRRYEKRATAQTMQTEARLQDLETRLQDALSLAAAAAKNSQRPGILAATIQWTLRLITDTVNVLTYPLRLASDMSLNVLEKLGLNRPLRRKRPTERQRRNDAGRGNKERPVLRAAKPA